MGWGGKIERYGRRLSVGAMLEFAQFYAGD